MPVTKFLAMLVVASAALLISSFEHGEFSKESQIARMRDSACKIQWNGSNLGGFIWDSVLHLEPDLNS